MHTNLSDGLFCQHNGEKCSLLLTATTAKGNPAPEYFCSFQHQVKAERSGRRCASKRCRLTTAHRSGASPALCRHRLVVRPVRAPRAPFQCHSRFLSSRTYKGCSAASCETSKATTSSRQLSLINPHLQLASTKP